MDQSTFESRFGEVSSENHERRRDELPAREEVQIYGSGENKTCEKSSKEVNVDNMVEEHFARSLTGNRTTESQEDLVTQHFARSLGKNLPS
ncbi:hypothetical protein TrispH2_001143 [Trichoplax sp. H2]|nr:hypothetical protein TrispH2_001143 [Trichoplax sp. H2]|eukprot:RDD46781.1 hypothetical protein TrispH2_001143 [Trichoplax sp. H2]